MRKFLVPLILGALSLTACNNAKVNISGLTVGGATHGTTGGTTTSAPSYDYEGGYRATLTNGSSTITAMVSGKAQTILNNGSSTIIMEAVR